MIFIFVSFLILYKFYFLFIFSHYYFFHLVFLFLFYRIVFFFLQFIFFIVIFLSVIFLRSLLFLIKRKFDGTKKFFTNYKNVSRGTLLFRMILNKKFY